jgi:hypothetical protein
MFNKEAGKLLHHTLRNERGEKVVKVESFFCIYETLYSVLT